MSSRTHRLPDVGDKQCAVNLRNRLPLPSHSFSLASLRETSMPASIKLLSSRRFRPFFVTQLSGAFNDNLYKNGLTIFIAFQAAGISLQQSNILVNMAAGLFILPFFLFSPLAGQLADKYEKSMLIQRIKLLEIAIMLLGAACFSVTESGSAGWHFVSDGHSIDPVWSGQVQPVATGAGIPPNWSVAMPWSSSVLSSLSSLDLSSAST